MSSLGLEIASLIFQPEALHKTAFHIYILATFLAPLTVLTGLHEADELHLHHPVVTLHKNFALSTMFGSILSLPILWFFHQYQPKVFRIIFFVFLVLAAGCVALAGYNGGRMVYEFGVGVEH